MTYGEFKQLNLFEGLPMEVALVDALKRGLINVNEILSAYTHALEIERHEMGCRFEEANLCIYQHLTGNFKGEHEEELHKRMIHISNCSKTFVTHSLDKQYGYTEEDEKRYDELCENLYGVQL